MIKNDNKITWCIAVFIALPLFFLAVTGWLETFSYRVNLQWRVFILTSLFTLGIATVTVCLHALKTALSNPVKNLKTE